MACRLIRRASLLALGLCAAGAVASGQDDAATPRRDPRRLAFGVEGLATVSTEDDEYFNYSSYGQSATRLMRLRVDASLRLGDRAAVLAEGRMDNGDGPSLSALYLRVRPLANRAFDIQAGRIPPVFGAFTRRAYGADNPLIGLPLAYQYLTSLRSDSLPSSAHDLLLMKGLGWQSYYPIGSPTWDNGLPLVAADRWDTGVQARVVSGRVTAAAAVSQGTLSNPRVRDDNSGKQVSGRVELRPVLGLVLGASAAHGDYVSRDAETGLPPEAREDSHTQRAFGADAEFSRGYWLLRAEGVWSRWSVPRVAAPFFTGPLRSWGVFVEGRRKIRPGLFVAGRYDHLGFSRITDPYGPGTSTPWDAPVSRVELGAGFSLRRNLLLKAAVQQNWRSGYSERIAAAQALFWY
jgi:hypothetical protein